jgi:uncharacterized membrane protein
MARGRSGRGLAPSRSPAVLPRGGTFLHAEPVVGQEVALAAYFAGPLPAPEVLFEYDQALDGTADRIIRMAEREAEHRHHVELQLVAIQARNSTLGIASGLVLGLAGVLGGVFAVVHGADGAGAGVALTALTALVGVFVTQRRTQRREAAESQAA